MNTRTSISSGGRNEKVADMLLNRLLPNEQMTKVGPFIFLGHVYPILIQKQEPQPYRGQYAHPSRGIVTFSYVLSGSFQYVDSHNHSGIIASGGALWRNAGTGIIHEERPDAGFFREGGILHVVQFSINLPGFDKWENPALQALPAQDIPELELPGNAGVLKVLLGSCGVLRSPLKIYLNEFIFHIRLNPKSTLSYPTKKDIEYAVFVPAGDIRINDMAIGNSHLLVCPQDDPAIQLYNPSISIADVFLFGGQEYLEPIVVVGPFVMNDPDEIARAYGDYFAGRYGELSKATP